MDEQGITQPELNEMQAFLEEFDIRVKSQAETRLALLQLFHDTIMETWHHSVISEYFDIDDFDKVQILSAWIDSLKDE